MVKIIDCNKEEFQRRTKDKRIFLFGAGTRAQMYYKYFSMEDKVEAIIDNDVKIQNTQWRVSEKVGIIGIKDFVELVRQRDVLTLALFITPMYYLMDIIDQVNDCPELENMDCYIGNMVISHYTKKEFSFTMGEQKIPKKIHYCWFGKTEIPEKLQEYMKSWKKYCPDYEIIRWDESNYDVKKNKYMYQAYQNEKWGFVPDYARLDIIYNEGGIYLDTDVEILANIDHLLNDEMFCGAVSDLGINLGLGFGAVKNNRLIKECRDAYDNVLFYKEDGSLNLVPCVAYQNASLEKNGFKICNEYQKIENCVVYPSEVLSPTMNGESSAFTNKTVSIHHSAKSWISDDEKKGWNKMLEFMKSSKCLN
jgi:hypothetical protein